MKHSGRAKTRLLSLLLAAIMTAGMLPLGALADEAASAPQDTQAPQEPGGETPEPQETAAPTEPGTGAETPAGPEQGTEQGTEPGEPPAESPTGETEETETPTEEPPEPSEEPTEPGEPTEEPEPSGEPTGEPAETPTEEHTGTDEPGNQNETADPVPPAVPLPSETGHAVEGNCDGTYTELDAGSGIVGVWSFHEGQGVWVLTQDVTQDGEEPPGEDEEIILPFSAAEVMSFGIMSTLADYDPADAKLQYYLTGKLSFGDGLPI